MERAGVLNVLYTQCISPFSDSVYMVLKIAMEQARFFSEEMEWIWVRTLNSVRRSSVACDSWAWFSYAQLYEEDTFF